MGNMTWHSTTQCSGRRRNQRCRLVTARCELQSRRGVEAGTHLLPILERWTWRPS